MACLICDRSADYDLVRDGETEGEVCEPCTEEFLAVDEGDPTCVYCDDNGVYDVRTRSDGGFPGAEGPGDTFATPYESVLCEDHFAELGGETPAGSPEAADEADVEGEGEEAGDDERAEASPNEAEGGDESDADAAESDANHGDATKDDSTAEGDAQDEGESGDGADAAGTSESGESDEGDGNDNPRSEGGDDADGSDADGNG